MVLIEKEDFERDLGRELSENDWILTNDLYKHTTLSYDDFLKCHRKGDHGTLLRDLINQIEEREVEDKIVFNKMQNVAVDLLSCVNRGDVEMMRGMIRDFVGIDSYVKMSLEYGFKLDDNDRRYILEHLKEG